MAFAGGNQSVGDIWELLQLMADGSNQAPTSGGTLSINSISLGSYDYCIKVGNQTVSAFSSADWFTTTEDSRSAFVVVVGDLTINSGQTFRPDNRKLFTTIYVTGNLVVNGSVSMSARGARHGAIYGNVAAGAIRIYTGTLSSVTNPEVPAAGGAGSSGTGGAGSAGGTGGGGGGANAGSQPPYPGNGVAGTSFSGGGGGGSTNSTDAGQSGQTATTNGGPGGNAGGPIGNAGGGAGNLGGANSGGGTAGGNGTGGVLIVFCAGEYSGSGSVVAAGASCTGQNPGGASGGGSVTIVYGTDAPGPTPTAAGGTSTGTGTLGGGGGAGTARKLTGLQAMLSADPGSYITTGAAAILLAARILSADPGSYAVTGVAARGALSFDVYAPAAGGGGFPMIVND